MEADELAAHIAAYEAAQVERLVALRTAGDLFELDGRCGRLIVERAGDVLLEQEGSIFLLTNAERRRFNAWSRRWSIARIRHSDGTVSDRP
jgi:hypothetical protein